MPEDQLPEDARLAILRAASRKALTALQESSPGIRRRADRAAALLEAALDTVDELDRNHR